MRRLQHLVLSAMAFITALGGSTETARAAVSKVDGGIRFTYVDAAAGAVSWAGDYNAWNMGANPMAKGEGGVWSVVVPLPPGEHSYKFVVDNNWVADPENPETKGEFGNSVITIAPDGSLVGGAGTAAGAGPSSRDNDPERSASEVKANTPYSAKLEFHGRGIGLYESYLSRENSRYELRRPRLDFDLETAIRISDVLTGRWVMKINSEEEALDLFRTRLTFDRGNLTFRKDQTEVFAYDNETSGTWDDPLHLVGDVGIYGYDYGYERQGIRVRPAFLGFRGEFHYADNFASGGTTDPPFDSTVARTAVGSLEGIDDGAGGFALSPGTFANGATINVSDANEDMVALRLQRDIKSATIGLLARSDRGFDLGSGAFVVSVGGDRVRTVSGLFEQLWYGYGLEARGRVGPEGLELFGEVLAGRRVADFLSGAQATSFQVTFDDTGAVDGATPVVVEDAGNKSVVLDRSRRFAGGARWIGDLFGAASNLTGTITYHDHDDRPSVDGVEAEDRGRRSTWSARGRWDQSWGGVIPRAVATILDVEWQGFSYRPDDPWDAQFWFAARNFWLEHDGDEVGPDRIVMLGGRDVWTFRPEVRVPILADKNCAFEYAGRIHTHSLTTRPKFIESFFRVGYDLTPELRAQADTRWVKYDDPTLNLHSGYVDPFLELAYTFIAGVQVAVSYGVDPWVLDRATNQYAYRGRDDVLAAGGVGSAGARTAYLDQGPIIAQAEKAMRDLRRIAVEAIVRF
jgi:hypothetical protein